MNNENLTLGHRGHRDSQRDNEFTKVKTSVPSVFSVANSH